jgi:TrmH family RNA methyltransferase
MTTRIESLDNPRVKLVVRLRDRRARRETGQFLVEGARELGRALESGRRPEFLFLEEGRASVAAVAAADRARSLGALVIAVNAAVFRKVAMREDSDGVLAVLPIPDVGLDRLRVPAEPLVLAAIGIEKPGNLGALLRSADAFGVDALVVAGGTDLWNPNVVRASLGCVFTVPVAEATEEALVVWLAERGVRLVAASPGAGVPLPEADLRGAVALLLGSEEQGLGGEALAAAEVRVRIPMKGSADSLNVSVAAGILLYEAARQRAR